MGRLTLPRIDADISAATQHCLERPDTLAVNRGVVLFRDSGRFDGCRLAVDEFPAALPERTFLHHVDAASRSLAKQADRSCDDQTTLLAPTTHEGTSIGAVANRRSYSRAGWETIEAAGQPEMRGASLSSMPELIGSVIRLVEPA